MGMSRRQIAYLYAIGVFKKPPKGMTAKEALKAAGSKARKAGPAGKGKAAPEKVVKEAPAKASKTKSTTKTTSDRPKTSNFENTDMIPKSRDATPEELGKAVRKAGIKLSASDQKKLDLVRQADEKMYAKYDDDQLLGKLISFHNQAKHHPRSTGGPFSLDAFARNAKTQMKNRAKWAAEDAAKAAGQTAPAKPAASKPAAKPAAAKTASTDDRVDDKGLLKPVVRVAGTRTKTLKYNDLTPKQQDQIFEEIKTEQQKSAKRQGFKSIADVDMRAMYSIRSGAETKVFKKYGIRKY